MWLRKNFLQYGYDKSPLRENSVQKVTEKANLHRLLKNAQMQGSRNPEE